MSGGRPPKYETPEEMQEVIDQYFSRDGNAYIEMGDDAKMYAPTVSGLALELGLSRQALLDYQKKDAFLDTIKRAKQKIELALEQRLYGNAVTGTIFNLKNNFGWKDQKQQEITGPDGSPVTVAALAIEGDAKEASRLYKEFISSHKPQE